MHAGEGWSWFFEHLHISSTESFDTIDRLHRARLLIEARYWDKLTLDEMARAACYSRYHFLRLFEHAYCQTPGRFLQQRRLQEARRLLVETEEPVTDVSFAVGFRSLGSFSRTFREQTGLSPVQYRRRVFPGVRLHAVRVPCCFSRMFAGEIATSEKPGVGSER